MDNTTLGMFVHVILQTCSSYTIKDSEDQLFCESRFRGFWEKFTVTHVTGTFHLIGSFLYNWVVF